jgi:Protein of unknown function (DUF3667)
METCKNCQNQFTGKFCNACGQKVYTDSDKSLKHIFTELFHFLTHFEGTFFTTLKTIFTKPGQLSLDYCNGIRKKYFKPISFYLLIVVVYLIFPVAHGLNPKFNEIKQDSYVNRSMVLNIESIKKTRGYNDEVLSVKYNEKADKISKLLLFIFIPFGAFLLYLLSFRKKFAFDYFILSTEINSFFLLSFFVIVPVLLMSLFYLKVIKDIDFDDIALPISCLLYFIYLSLAFHKFFKEKYIWSILRAIIFPALHFIFLAKLYKLILISITLYLL